ncbi:MAG: hypothetical protein ACOCZU_01420 [Planctomycetota bacterium]
MNDSENNQTHNQLPGPDDLDRLMQEYVDGTLEGRRLREFERRLENDESLRGELEAYSALARQIEAELDRDVPGVDYEAMRADILAAVERKVIMQGPSHSRLLRWRPMVGGLAAAAAIVLAVSVWLVVSTPSQTNAGVEQASVSMVPAAPEQGGEEFVSVSLAEPQWDQVVLSPEAAFDSPEDLPAGTVMVSVGEESADSAALEYPILVH